LKIGAGVLVILAVALAAVVAYRWHREQRPKDQAALTAVPFTALPGEETSPAFSADGSRIAFAWNGDPAPGTKCFDLYVKPLGAKLFSALRIIPRNVLVLHGRSTARRSLFSAWPADTGIYVVPALGGSERKLHSTRIPWENFSAISWSPDGRRIAFSDLLSEEEHAMIYLLSAETLETERITNGSKCLAQGQPAFSHRGDHLAYLCFISKDEFSLHSLPLPTGRPKVISHFEGYPKGLTWSADDKELFYSIGMINSNELGEVAVANGLVKRLAFAGNAVWPTVSSIGDKIAFSSFSSSPSPNIWRKDLQHPEAPAVELISSTRAEYNAQYSPDGKRIVFASERAGTSGVWISNEDGSNLVQISNPNYISGSPQWSPDGKKIAFDSRPLDHWEIYVADVTERNPRKLLTNISSVYRPRWSRDGKWIYFRSYEAGKTGIYRCPASGGDVIALSRDIDAVSPNESFDGKTLYSASPEYKSTLKRINSPCTARNRVRSGWICLA
jgi:Tol biopolymer transport system component